MPLTLDLPEPAVSDRVSCYRHLAAGEQVTCAQLDGPGCIRHIWAATRGPHLPARQIVLRIHFDEEPVPHVEAPLGDFFGVMHGLHWYAVNTPYLSVKSQSGYNCYFPMPFAQAARITVEAGDHPVPFYMMVDWHRYPDRTLAEPRRFCARWRREMPTRSYGDGFLMLDADGPGQLIGFAYGVRLLDDTDRWSHGGADNIYIDGADRHPAYLRGIGGEDTFGTSYGGALHEPETHLYAAIPYYTHEDTGEARPAQRLAGYRFFEHDAVGFRRSLQMRFGCMENDICATTWWYQQTPVRPFFEMPEPARRLPGVDLRAGTCDLPLPASGTWWLCGPFGNQGETAMAAPLAAESTFDAGATHDGRHVAGSPWLSAGSRSAGRDVARWVRRDAAHGFVDFNHVFQPHDRGAGRTHPGVAIARGVLHAARAMTARVQVTWDDRLTLGLNDGPATDLGHHAAFRARSIEVDLRQGANTVVLKLSNTPGSSHGGWAFAFQATAPDGTRLLPQAEQ